MCYRCLRSRVMLTYPRWIEAASISLLDALVVICGGVDEAAVVQLDLVWRNHARRHVLIPVHELHDRTWLPAALRVAQDPVSLPESQFLDLLRLGLGRRGARLESRLESFVVEVLADKDKLALTLLTWCPLLVEVAVEDHVHRLVHEFLRGIGDGQD